MEATPLAAYKRIIDNAKIKLPGSITAGIQTELYNVLDEFLRESDIWREEICFDTVAGVSEYDIVPVTGSIVHLISLKYVDGLEVILAGSMPIPGILTFLRTPDDAKECIVTISLSVLDPVTKAGWPQCPAWILERYHRGISDGIVYRMALQPGKPYSNEELAVVHGQSFRNQIGLAKVDYMHQNVRAAQAWLYPRFA